ncbi:MAG: PucR family transcriptional regulator, partial [Rhodococcus sp. (in: high G+C Gram-positive bacteria)]
MAATMSPAGPAESVNLGGRPASHQLRVARETTARLVEHVLTTARCQDLTGEIGRSAVADIAEVCVALAADVLDSGVQPTSAELS